MDAFHRLALAASLAVMALGSSVLPGCECWAKPTDREQAERVIEEVEDAAREVAKPLDEPGDSGG